MQASKKAIIQAKRKNYSQKERCYACKITHIKNKKMAMKKSFKERKRANTKAGKQACTRLAGQHPNIKEAPENKLFGNLAKKYKNARKLT